MTTKEILNDINPEALLADGLETALIGYTANHHHNTVAVYSVSKCLAILMKNGATQVEAREWLDFNTLDAYVGDNGPIFVEDANDD